MDIFLEESSIAKMVKSVARRMNSHYKEVTEPVVLLCVLKGSFIFTADLSRKLNFPHRIEFIKCSTYKGKVKGSSKIDYWPEMDLDNKDIVFIEDIVDSGGTLLFLQEEILRKGYEPRSVTTASLLKRRSSEYYVNFLGRIVEEGLWIYGYGMDHPQEMNRNLSSIYK